LAVALVVLAGCGSSLHRSGGGQGPLVPLIGGRVGIGQPTAVGKPMSVSGDLIVKNTGSDAVALDRVELVGLRNVTYLGAYIVPFPLHQTPFTAAFSYRVPPNGRVLPGVTVAPHTRAWVVVGLTPTRGQHRWTRMDLVYHDGAATYRRHVAISGALCAPFRTYLGHCRAPGPFG